MGTHVGPDQPKRGQDEPKRSFKSLKVPKACISKNLKNVGVSMFLGSKDFQDSLGSKAAGLIPRKRKGGIRPLRAYKAP